MTSTKKQALLRLQPDVLAAGKAAAAARGLDFNKYVECLISEDTTGAARPA
jgi:predicted DNA binding CopG/RHH family protein